MQSEGLTERVDEAATPSTASTSAGQGDIGPEKTSATLNKKLAFCIEKGRISHALGVILELRALSVPPEAKLYNKLVMLCCRKKRLRDARRLVDISDAAISDAAFRALVTASAAVGDIDTAEELLSRARAKGVRLTPPLYTSLMSCFARDAARKHVAISLWEELKSSAGAADIDVQAFNAAIYAFARAGSWRDIEGILKDMNKRGLKANERTFNTLIYAYGKHKRRKEATRVLESMREANITPTEVTYNALIGAYVALKDVAHAVTTCDNMIEAGLKPTVQTYTTLLKGYTDAADMQSAFSLLRKMRTNTSSKPNAVTYANLISGCVRAHNLELALGVYNEANMDNVDITPAVHNALLAGFAKRRRLDETIELFNDMKKKANNKKKVSNNKEVNNNNISKVNTGSNNHEEVNHNKKSSVNNNNNHHNNKEVDTFPNVVTYNTLLMACVLHEDLPAAQRFFGEMRAAAAGGVRPNVTSYTTLMRGYACARQPDDALRLFEEMQSDEHNNNNNIRPDVVAFNTVIDAFARVGRAVDANAVYQRMRSSGVRPTVATFGALIKCYGKASDADGAMRAYDAMRAELGAEGVDEKAYDALVDVCLRARRFNAALHLVDQMEASGIAPDRLKFKRLFIELFPGNTHGNKLSTNTHHANVTPNNNNNNSALSHKKGHGYRHQQQQQQHDSAGTVALQRFKFWLGLPNAYYAKEFDWRDM